MKATVDLKVKPFITPNYVLLADELPGGGEAKLPLSSLSSEALMTLIYEFEREVFKKAGKQRPARASC